MKPVIIIGTGIAAYTLAREFRKLDSGTPLLLISDDDGSSYPKPMLSNALTKGKSAQQIALFNAEQMAERLDAEIITHTLVSQIDPQANTVILSDDRQLNYSRLILAVGAKPISVPMEGNAVQDVLSINDLADYTIFREKLASAKRVAIIGPGLIGCEFGNDLLNVGIDVSIIGPGDYPMNTLLPEIIAKDLQHHLQTLGADWRLSTTTRTINKTEQNSYELVLDNGDKIEADLILSAVGLRANTELAQAAGLAVNRGIITDTHLQTSVKDIYAIGDCAEVAGHNLLFIAPIIAGAKALASTLTGNMMAVNYPAMPVVIKTPAYPLVVAPPARDKQGEWQFEQAESGFGFKGLFIAENDELLGFALSGDMVSEKQLLTSQIAPLLS